jgi:hypothetical protein
MKKIGSEGDGCNNAMDIEYQNAIQKKTKNMSEGKAVLEWLSENEKANKAKTIKEAKDRSHLMKIFRPNEEVK